MAGYKECIPQCVYQYMQNALRATFLFHKLNFAFRTREIKLITLDDPPYLEASQRHGNSTYKLRRIIQERLSLPSQVENSYIYTSSNTRGAGLWDLHDEYNLQQLVQAFKLVNSNDDNISSLIIKTLISTASSRLHIENPFLSQALQWLNGNID